MYELVSPVNVRAILKYVSELFVGIGATFIPPILVAVYFLEYQAAAWYAATAIVIALAGLMLLRLLPDYDLELKEALVIAAIIFPLTAAIYAIPVSVSAGMPLLDAFFETVSGITTTGLSVAPAGAGSVFLFTRSWLQWIGGIGIVLIVLSLIVPPGVSAFRLFSANFGEKKLKPGVAASAKLLGKIYLSISLAAFLLLFLSGMSPFDALCHTLSTVSTGGFSTQSASVAGFGGAFIPVAVIAACVMGSVNFALYARVLKEPLSIFRGIQFRWFAVVAVIGTALLLVTMAPFESLASALPDAMFQALSALTTAGFSTVDISLLPDSSKAVLTGLMWIGGSVGSTAGGIKILRLIIIVRIMHLVFIRFFLPKEALTPLKVGGEVIETEAVYHVVTFMLLYVLVIIFSAFALMLYGIGLDNALFEVSSALGTVGLSCGVTGAALPGVLKAVLIGDMILGRIEIIPLCILFFPRTWWRKAA